MSTPSPHASQRYTYPPPMPAQAPEPAAAAHHVTAQPQAAEARRVVTAIEAPVALFSLTLFIGSAVALRESVLTESNGVLFATGCALLLAAAAVQALIRPRRRTVAARSEVPVAQKSAA